MATNYKSDLLYKRTRANTVNDSELEVITASFVLPAGVSIAQNDTFQVAYVSALHTIEQIRVFTSQLDDGTTIAWNIGNQQILPVNTSGAVYGGVDPTTGVARDFDVPSGLFQLSPATNATYFITGSTFGRTAGWSSLTLANTGDTQGPGGASPGPYAVLMTQSTAGVVQTTSSAVARNIRVELSLVRSTPAQSQNLVHFNGY